jgi:hypothetical protein
MATRVYKTKNVHLFDGTEIEISPLKIKYLREFMDVFNLIKETKTDDEAMIVLLECTRICMKQFYPEVSHSVEDTEDSMDLKTMHEILDIGAGIKLGKQESESPVKEQAQSSDTGPTWENLDLVKLETEVFLLGNWKNFGEMEQSLNMAELTEILSSKRDLDHQEKKFMAAIQGIDLEGAEDDPQKQWEDMKARVFSKGQTSDANDIVALQGQNAANAGFGIGMGLSYDDLRDPSAML